MSLFPLKLHLLPDVASVGTGRTPVVASKDESERFYVITTEGEKKIPVVRVISLEVDEEV